jgi:hypothetical protein
MAQVLGKAQLLNYCTNPDGEMVHELIVELNSALQPVEHVIVYNCEEYVFQCISPDRKHYLFVLYDPSEEIIF